MLRIAQAKQQPEEIVSLVCDGGSSFFLPHFVIPPKVLAQKNLLEIAPYITLNNSQSKGSFYFHFGNHSQDLNFVISILWQQLQTIFAKQENYTKQILYLQVSTCVTSMLIGLC